MKKDSLSKLLILGIFAAAMGFLETVIVVYLREMYYESGFNFPLAGFVEPNILAIEWARELATIVMLVSVAILAGKKFYERCAYFIFAFAIWDIFYYVFLKVLLDWPASLLTWDVLFLIPWPWVGPVLAPLLCTMLMLVATYLILDLDGRGKKINANFDEAIFLLLGIAIVLWTWMYDYGAIIIGGGFFSDFFKLASNPDLMALTTSFVPVNYNWSLFFVGYFSASIAIVKFYFRNLNKN